MVGERDTAADRRGVVTVGRFAELEEALVERVRELRSDAPLSPLTVVVGSGLVRTRVGDLLVRRLGAVANVAVVTLARLATDVAAQTSGVPPRVLGALCRERLVRRLVASSGTLEYFSRVAERPHFADALAATFADLREAGVEPARGWERHVVDPATLGGQAKARDLGVLYAAYCEALESLGALDRAGVYSAAAEALAVAPGSYAAVAARATLLYGIYDLNVAQERLADALLRRGSDVFVPLAGDADEDLATMLAVARRAGLVERRAPAPDAPADRECVAFLARGTSDAGPPARLAGDGSLRVVSVTDERAEAREAVRAVLEAAHGGVALWDCAVVVPHADDVDRLAHAALDAGLRVAARRPDRSAGPRLLARLVDCLAPPAGAALARRAVVDLLSSTPLRRGPVAPPEAALWLDEARRAGVVAGAGQWRERMARRHRGVERQVRELETRGDDPAFAGDEDALPLDEARARFAAAASLSEAAATLADACEALPSRGSWHTWVAALSRLVHEVFAPEPAGEAADVLGRLEELEVLDEEVELADVATVVREQLAGAAVQHGRVGRDGVAVVTPLELRGLRFHTVVFCGLAEGGFPAKGRPDPILGDAARRRVAEALDVRLPLGELRDAESRLLFAFAGQAARERLVLLAPRTDAASGRPRLPSRLLLRLASSQAGHPVGLDEFLSGAPLASVWRHAGSMPRSDAESDTATTTDPDAVWVDARERDIAVLRALGGAGGAGRTYLDVVLGDAALAGRRLSAWRAGRSPEPGPWDGVLGGKARAALAARRLFAAEMHPTRLERYVACPFAFLLRDVLGLHAPDEPAASLDMDGREFGTLVHAVLEATYAATIAGDLGLDETLVALERAWEAGCADAERRGVTGAALAWDVRRGLLLDDLTEAVRRDPVFAAGDGRPFHVEWRFGARDARQVSLEVAEGIVVRFAGRLDRVDLVAGGARIVDYKTGSGRTEKERLKDGLSIQLPVYRLALRQTGGEDYEAVRCAYRLVTRRGGFVELALDDDEEVAEARLRHLVARTVALVDAGVFARSTGGRCEYCDVRYACGLTAWARTRKRGHGALSALVALQHGDLGEEGDDAGA